MVRKYIKGKDGKFEGSLPDESSRPQLMPELPKLPQKDSATSSSEIPSFKHPAAKAWDRVRKLEQLINESKKAKTAYRSAPLFSEARKTAKAEHTLISSEANSLRKLLQQDCWRCYGTGKPLNSYGDTFEIFERCPDCNNLPLPSPPPKW